MYFKEMVEHADDGVRPFTYVEGFVNKVIDLTWYSLAAYSKDCTFPWCSEVHGTRLEGVIGVEHLLGHVEGVVGVDGARAGCCFLCWWWRTGEKSPGEEKNWRTEALALSMTSLYKDRSLVTSSRWSSAC